MFVLDGHLQRDCKFCYDMPLCSVLIMNNNRYPWFILVPRVERVYDVIDLTDEQQMQLWKESALVSRIMRRIYMPTKLNVAALGNMVRQLHVHHIARHKTDDAWPDPVWSGPAGTPYRPGELDDTALMIAGEIERKLPEIAN